MAYVVYRLAELPPQRAPEEAVIAIVKNVLGLIREEIQKVEILDDTGSAIEEQVVGENVRIKITFGSKYSDQIGLAHDNWGQVICNGNQTTGFSKGAFVKEYGCAKDGTDYISSKDIESQLTADWDETGPQKVLTLGPYTRASPGSNRWAIRILPGGVFKYYVDVPFRPQPDAFEYRALHLGMVNETVEFGNGEDIVDPAKISQLCKDHKDAFGTWKSWDCAYRFLGDTSIARYDSNGDGKSEAIVDTDCKTYGGSDICGKLSFFDLEDSRIGREILFGQFLDRAEAIGADTVGIQIRFYVTKSRFPDNPDPAKAASAARFVIFHYPGATPYWEVIDDLVKIMRERVDAGKGTITKLMIEPGLDEMSVQNLNPNECSGSACNDAGPISVSQAKKMSAYLGYHPVQQGHCNVSERQLARHFILDEVRCTYQPDQGNPPCAQGNDLCTNRATCYSCSAGQISGGSLTGIRTDFFNGNIYTTGPTFKAGWNGSLNVTKLESATGDPLDIGGDDCITQEAKGVYNYGCLLQTTAKHAKIYKDTHGIDVLFSLVNDHGSIAAVLPYVKMKNGLGVEQDLLAIVKEECGNCKLTTGIFAEGIDESWVATDQVDALKELYKRSEIDYVGINGWVRGACVGANKAYQIWLDRDYYKDPPFQILPAGIALSSVIGAGTDCTATPIHPDLQHPPDKGLGDANKLVDPDFSYIFRHKGATYKNKVPQILGSTTKPLLILETGAANDELVTYNFGAMGNSGTYSVGFTNVMDNQEQVDAIEADAAAFFDGTNPYVIGPAGRLKGIVYFNDEAVWEKHYNLYQYQVSQWNKGLSGFLKVLFNK
jgi:hypothetical protein